MLAGKQVTDAYAALWQTALPVLLPHLTELSVGQVDASGPALMRTLALTAAAAEQAGKPLPLRRLSMHRMCLQGEQQAGSPSGSMTSGAGAGAGVGGSPLPGGGPTSRPKPLAGRSPLGLVVGSMSHGPGGDNHDGDRVPSASQLTTPPLPPSAAAAVGGAADADAPPATPAPLDSRGGTSPNNIIDNAKPHHDDDDGTTAAAAAAAAPPDTPSDVHRTYDEVATPASTIGPATPATPDAKLLPISPGRVAYLASVESAWRSLATALSHMPNLTALELVSCALNSMHIDTLAKGLAKCRALEELDLSRNSGMGTAGASALAQALPRLSRLRQLSLVDSLMRGPDVRPLVVALVGHPTCGALECVTVGGRQGLASDHSCVSTEDIKELCHLWVTARHLMSASLVFAVPSPTSKLSPAKSTELEKAERMALALAAMAGGGKRKGGGLFGCFGGGGAVDTQKWRDYWSARQAAVHIIAKETRN